LKLLLLLLLFIMNNIPDEILNKIYNYYISRIHFKINQQKWNNVLCELLNKEFITLHLSEDLYDFELDYIYATRLPKLVAYDY